MLYTSKWRYDLETIKNKIKKYKKEQVKFDLDENHEIKLKRRNLDKDYLVKVLLSTNKITSWEEQKHNRGIVRHRVAYKESNNYEIVIVFEFRKNEIIIRTAWRRDLRLTKKFMRI